MGKTLLYKLTKPTRKCILGENEEQFRNLILLVSIGLPLPSLADEFLGFYLL